MSRDREEYRNIKAKVRKIVRSCTKMAW